MALLISRNSCSRNSSLLPSPLPSPWRDLNTSLAWSSRPFSKRKRGDSLRKKTPAQRIAAGIHWKARGNRPVEERYVGIQLHVTGGTYTNIGMDYLCECSHIRATAPPKIPRTTSTATDRRGSHDVLLGLSQSST